MPARNPKPKRPKPPPPVVKTVHYLDQNGRDIINDWLRKMSDEVAHEAVTDRLFRMRGGLFGDCRPVGSGVWELRVDVGPGYRVYYAKDGLTVGHV